MSTGGHIFSILFSILLLLDIVGNTLVIRVISKYRAMKTPMNYLLLNMAVADMMVGVFFAPRFIFIHLFKHPTGTTGDVLCKTVTGMNVGWIASLVSAFTLVCVAFERFYAVVHPTSIRHKITKRKLKWIVPACWILATVHTIPSFTKTFSVGMDLCRPNFTEKWHLVTYEMVWLFSAAILPVCVLVVLYSKIIHSLRLQNNGDVTRLAVISARKRITKKSITVSVLYAFCIFPSHILYFLSIFYPDIYVAFLEMSHCFLVLNSSVNPFVYTFQCVNFRKYLKRLVLSKNRCPAKPRISLRSSKF